MARPSRTGGKTNDAKGSKTTVTKRGTAAVANRVKPLSVSDPSKDLKVAREQQAATAEILKVIASSPSDVQPVLEAVAERAMSLLDAWSVVVTRFDGKLLRFGAARGALPDTVQFLRNSLPARLEAGGFGGRCILERSAINISDALADPSPQNRDRARLRGFRAALSAPMFRNGQPIGAITVTRSEPGAFATNEVELLQTFADQAVIAIENTRLFNEVQTKSNELSDALTHQTASGNILGVIASSPTDVEPALQAIVESASELCASYDTAILLKIGDDLDFSAHHGPISTGGETRRPINPRWTVGRAVLDKRTVHVADVFGPEGDAFPETREMARVQGHRCVLVVPLLREGQAIGAIALRRLEPVPFNEKQIALLQTFADQAVIAIENARLFNETKEALERQTATAEILKVIASSPTDAAPVFDAIVRSAKRLLGGYSAGVYRIVDGILHLEAFTRLNPEADEALRNSFPVPISEFPQLALVEKGQSYQYADTENAPEIQTRIARARGFRSILLTPLRHGGTNIGLVVVTRAETGSFADHYVELMKTFADQAVIAIENVRLFNETREALERQTATADILKVIASSPDDVQPVFQAIADQSKRLLNALAVAVYSFVDDMVHLMSFTPVSPTADDYLKASFPIPLEASYGAKRSTKGEIFRIIDREDVSIPERERNIARNRGWRSAVYVPLVSDKQVIGAISVTRIEPGSFADHHVEILKTFADQAVIAISNVELFREVQKRTRELSKSLDELRAAQDRLVQTEKLASLGQLTAGIAHEIKNPLNFVNNFSALSVELTDELNDALKQAALAEQLRKEVDELTGLLKSNLEKVVQHGKRADSIVKNMLLHSREGSGERRSADINALLGESLNLAYHGARAEKAGFTITLQQDLDPEAGAIDIYPQEMTRALLNLISNGFYAAAKRKVEAGDGTFEPVLSAATRNLGKTVEIRIRDNGTGIPPEVREKMFNPFFTTKPTGEGTGLGLSMTHDIIVKQHGGRIDVATEPGAFTEFIITLPRGSVSGAKPE